MTELSQAKRKRTARQLFGDAGERLAAKHLEAKGYRIVARNVRAAGGEIDVVAVTEDTTIIVEVRARRGRSVGLPEDSISARKAARLFSLAEAYIAAHPELPPAARIDLVAVELRPDGRLHRVTHLEDIVTGG